MLQFKNNKYIEFYMEIWIKLKKFLLIIKSKNKSNVYFNYNELFYRNFELNFY
jgi:hypothetical protein